MGTELTTAEKHSLAQCEAAIERGQHAFIEVGSALLTIKEGKLYREGHNTFEAYCKARWGFTRTYAFRLIVASEVVSEMLPIGNKSETLPIGDKSGMLPIGNKSELSPSGDNVELPRTESQARELAKADPKNRKAAMKRAVKEAEKDGRRVTAADVAEAVATIGKESGNGKPAKEEPEAGKSPVQKAKTALGRITRLLEEHGLFEESRKDLQIVKDALK